MAGVDRYNGTTTRGAERDIINREQRERLDDQIQAEARKPLVTTECVVDGGMNDIARE